MSGRQVVSGLDLPFFLRGTNKYGFENYPAGGFWGDTYLMEWETAWHPVNSWNAPEGRAAVAQVLDAMKSWGINCVRFPQAIDHWKFNLGGHREIIKELLVMLEARGMYMVYAPFRTTGSDGGDLGGVLPYPPYTVGAESVIASEQEFIDYYASVASELQSYPNVIYEFYNEPNSGIWDEYVTGPAFISWKSVTQSCINAVRAAGANQIIIVQWWSGTTTNLSIAPDVSNTRGMDWVPYMSPVDPVGNLMYSIHVYRAWDSFYHQPGGPETRYRAWTMEDMVEAFNRFQTEEASLQYPILIGEIGCDMDASDLANELESFTNCLSLFDDRGYNYCSWWFSETGPFREHQGEASGFAPNDAGDILINALGLVENVVSPTVSITVLPAPLAVLTLAVDKSDGYLGDTFNFTGSFTQNGSAVVGETVTLYRNGVVVGSSVSDGVGDYLIPWVADVEGSLDFHSEGPASLALSKRMGVGVGASLSSLSPALLALSIGVGLIVVAKA